MSTEDKRTLTSPINGKNGGVKTAGGKAVSSRNAIKHGILAKYTVSFDDISFEEAYDMFATEFGDDSPSRAALINQLAILFIRMRRCARFESEYLKEKLNPPKYERKLVSQGLNIDMSCLEDKYEDVLVDPGSPMTLPPDSFSGLENVYAKYEPQFVGRFCHIVEFLTRSAK